ncbi:MAG: nucleoside deaminase [Methanomicrobiaceae archaeon]|nr:nucleoside deaminase [Methanomicrobiaceae archaeon]
MRRALEKAREGILLGNTPFGACIVRNGDVFSCRHNEVWKHTDITAHAEVLAIRDACRDLGTIDLSDCVLYATCEPCPMCFGAAHWARIPHIVYGASIRDSLNAGFNELTISALTMKESGNSAVRLTGGVLKNEAIDLFLEWLGRKDRRAY